MKKLSSQIPQTSNTEELMGIEGQIRQYYYAAFNLILNDFEMGNRTKRPPQNEVNALISFGNMVCYTICLRAIHQTQLNPTISICINRVNVVILWRWILLRFLNLFWWIGSFLKY